MDLNRAVRWFALMALLGLAGCGSGEFEDLNRFVEESKQGLRGRVEPLPELKQFEDRVLAPRIYGSRLNLPPIVVLVAVLVGGKVFGITGVLIALPATAAGRVCLDYFLERRSRALPAEGPAGEVLAPDNKPARPA